VPVTVSRKKFVLVLAAAAAVLVILSFSGQVYRYTIGSDRYLVSLFNLDEEYNIPTLFNSGLLLLSSLLMLGIGTCASQSSCRFSLHWKGLSLIFGIMAVDELLLFHEQLSTPIRTIANLSGIFYFAWVIPASVLLVILAAVYLRFFLSLSGRMKLLVSSAAFLFIGGALGFELIGGTFQTGLRSDTLQYAALTNAEETLELSGLLVLIHALMLHLEERIGHGCVMLRVHARPTAAERRLARIRIHPSANRIVKPSGSAPSSASAPQSGSALQSGSKLKRNLTRH
jgi:hypothetical protein